MKRQVIYTAQAKQDVKNIYEYILYFLQAPIAAANTYHHIQQAAHSLEEMAERNPLYREDPWHSEGLRFIPVKNYLILYFIEDTTISIVRVLYSRRNISQHLGQYDNKK